MHVIRRATTMRVVCLSMTLLTTADAQDVPQADSLEAASLGEALFIHNWARPATWTRPEVLGDGGDGLGPLFNEVSCVSCHSVGGIGGAGRRDHNLELLSVDIPRGTSNKSALGLVKRAKSIHPQITPYSVSVVLHRSGFGADDEMTSYDDWRASLVSRTSLPDDDWSTRRSRRSFSNVPLRITQRNPPALWGLGLIERLRTIGKGESRATVAIQQSGSSSGVTGRVPGTIDRVQGWFGWRGQVETLEDFVRLACVHEIGLTVSRHPQTVHPEDPYSRRSARRPKADLTDDQVHALTAFIFNLPRPQQVFPPTAEAQEQVHRGEELFSRIGCAECHVPSLGPVREIYSDLLVHDLGRILSDPSAAYPEPPTLDPEADKAALACASPESLRATTNSLARISGNLSLRVQTEEPTVIPEPKIRPNLRQEWRTPPLWGVADSAPYLHDGRAETLDEAIRLHDGEARPSAQRYVHLTETERSQLLAFLGTLRAPQPASVSVAAAP